MVGQEIGSYKLVSKIGEGGMGEVYIGEHLMLRRRVAVKLLLKEFNKEESVVKRFINEARATSQIVHPGIVQIFDFGKTADGSMVYMIMELLEGDTLLAYARKRGKLPVKEAVAIARQMADALGAAHKQNVVHRDLKPENVFLVPDASAPHGQRVKILDFGIAKMLDPAVSAPHTKTGSILGTPIYMSPEQCIAAPKIDHRADLYSLGCVFFHLLCGRPPFDVSGIGELLGAHVYTPAPVPSTITPAVPPSIDAIVIKLLQKKPDDRYANTADLVAALDEAPIAQAAVAEAEAAKEPGTPAPVEPERSAPEAATIIGSARGAKTPIPDVTARDHGPPDFSALPDFSAAPPKSGKSPLIVTIPPEVEKPKKEITTLGAAVGESESAIPQPEARRGNSMVTMAVAFGLTVTLALGGYFLFAGRGSTGDVVVPPPKPPIVTVTLTLDSDPPGAEVFRDGTRLGVTPYILVAPSQIAPIEFTLKKAGFDDAKAPLDGSHDGSARVQLVPTKPAN
ncbi:MAG TPA: protein kinase [Polyangia bacterium]|nr:protein kinase [Polyangia bacterium]